MTKGELDVASARARRVSPASNCGAPCPDKALPQSLEHTRCVLTLGKHVLGTTMPMPKGDPFMAEHRGILEAVREHDETRAESSLREHVESSCVEVVARAQSLRQDFEAPRLPYVGPR